MWVSRGLTFVPNAVLLVALVIFSPQAAAGNADAPASTRPFNSHRQPERPSPVTPAAAEADAIAADRPGLGDPPDVVSRGVVQIESGVEFASDRSTGILTETLAVPLASVRLGVGRGIELRLGVAGFLHEAIEGSPDDVAMSGHSDLTLGAKIELLQHDRAGFDLTLIPLLSLPAGSAAFTSGAVDPTVKLAWARLLPAGLELGGNLFVASESDVDERTWDGSGTLVLSRSLGDVWGVFAEVASSVPILEAGETEWTFATGLSRTIGMNVQLDVSVARGMAAAATDWIVGGGIAVRRVPRR